MRGIIVVIGNICSGKSSLVNALRTRYKELTPLILDDYRRKYGDGSKEGENEAFAQLVAASKAAHLGVAEMTGAGKNYAYYLGELRKAHKRILIVKLEAETKLLMKRLENRENEPVPLPWQLDPFYSIATLSNRLPEVYSDYTYNTAEKSAHEIVAELATVIETKFAVETPKKKTANFSAPKDLARLKEVIANFDYKEALYFVEHYRPELLRRYNRAKVTNLLERQLKGVLIQLAANPAKLLLMQKEKPTLEVNNLTKAIYTMGGRGANPKGSYPFELEQLVIQRSKNIQKVKRLANTLYDLRDKPEKAKEVVETILRLRQEIQKADKEQRHFDRHKKLSVEFKPEGKFVITGDNNRDILAARKQLSKNKKKLEDAMARDDAGKTVHYQQYVAKYQHILNKLIS